jgi:tol-pal system protein YbgF
MMLRLAFAALAFACCALCGAGPAHAQSSSDVLVRIDQLENQLRQLTGMIEQMQYRNQQLEAALKRMQEDVEFRFQEAGRGVPRPVAPTPGGRGVPAATTAAPPLPSGRRSDAFDPSENPAAPGVPRALGSIYGNAPPRGDLGTPIIMAEEPNRVAGPPLDLGTMASATPPEQGFARPRGAPPATGETLAAAPPTLPPSATPRDTFDLGYGYLQRRDYTLAEETFRDFLRKYPSDRQASDAEYFLGESLFSHQGYREAADAFLAVSKKFEASTKAPDALLRLGQSLVALNEKELACATFGEVGRKYPRASAGVKQSVEREQKRVHC